MLKEKGAIALERLRSPLLTLAKAGSARSACAECRRDTRARARVRALDGHEDETRGGSLAQLLDQELLRGAG